MKRAILEVWIGDKAEPELKNCLESPTDSEIKDELKSLPGGDQISALELKISKTHWIAIGGSVNEGFNARYHEFSRAGEWESIREDLPLELASQLLSNYRDQNTNWKNLIQWQRRPIAPVHSKEKEDREISEILGWFGKAAAFALGVYDAVRNGAKEKKRGRRSSSDRPGPRR
jgi:hypothetical protein